MKITNYKNHRLKILINRFQKILKNIWIFMKNNDNRTYCYITVIEKFIYIYKKINYLQFNYNHIKWKKIKNSIKQRIQFLLEKMANIQKMLMKLQD